MQAWRLRHDHGSAFMAEDFQNQIKAWGMLPSFSFVGQPETNGVMERFFRTFKEQVVHGRIFRTIDVFRDAARDFVLRYNTQWLIEKNGHLSSAVARQRGSTRICRVRHSATYCPRNRVRYIISVIRNFPYHLIGQHIGTFGGAADPRGRQALDPERAHHRLDLAGGGHRQHDGANRAAAAFQRRG